MAKFWYIFKKYLWILVLAGFGIAVITVSIVNAKLDNPENGQSTAFLLTLLGMIITYISFMIRPSKHDYAPNGKKWMKKFEFLNTTEQTKSHKDGSFEIYYIHHFNVLCSLPDGTKYNYELAKNGGVSGKDKTGKNYSKKISAKLYLKNLDTLNDEKN